MNRVYTLGAVLAIALTAIVMFGGEKTASAGLFNHCGCAPAPACGCGGGLLARLHARHNSCDCPPACHCGGLLSRIRARLAAMHCCGCQEAPKCAPACEPACAPAPACNACEAAPACDSGCGCK
jgi:hypothetical protein